MTGATLHHPGRAEPDPSLVNRFTSETIFAAAGGPPQPLPTLGGVDLADLVVRGLGSWWAPLLALAAGVVSFASPCVFPLVPGYLSFVAGLGPEGGRRRVGPILLFIAGFSAVFVALGAFTGAVQGVLRSTAGTVLTGILIAGFGAFLLLYGLRLGAPGLYAEKRPLLPRVPPGPRWAFPLGVAFGAGWTPCVGPVLAGVLALAASQGGAARAGLLLLCYSLGLGIPVLLVGLGLGRAVGVLGAVRRRYAWFAGAAGVAMIAIGVLVATDRWTRLIAPLLRAVGRFTPAL